MEIARSGQGGAQAKKKGRSGHERPKSREETPKEGYDNPSRARDVASQKLRVHRNIFKCKFCRAARMETKTSAEKFLSANLRGRSPGTKKGRSFAERPKSREETPKVGSGEW